MKPAAFIDVDGTLTKDISSWEKAHNYFGQQDEKILHGMERNTALYYDGKIDYNEWARLDVELWEGLPIGHLENALLPPIMIDEARRGVGMLKEQGFDIILVSGGIDILVNDVANRVGADAAFSNTIHHSDGRIDGRVTIGVAEKAPLVRKVAKEKGYDLKASIAIGDNFNDIDMFQAVGFSIAFNTKVEELKQVATHVMRNENFSAFVEEMLPLYHNGRLS